MNKNDPGGRDEGEASESERAAGSYPMRVVARLTGLSPDVIRAWERRYGAITPDRTAGNARRYSSTEVRRLQLLREAVTRGHQIGDIGALSTDDLRTLTSEPVDAPSATFAAGTVEAYLAAVSSWDLRGAEAQLARAASLHEPRALVLDVVRPILVAVGERWAHEAMSVAQEHAVSAQMRGLLGTLLRTASVDPGAPRIVCCAPEGHEHELGAMIGAVLAALRGMAPFYIGPNVPLAEAEAAASRSGARVVLFSLARDVSGRERARLTEGLESIAKRLDVWIGCPGGHALSHVQGAMVFHTYEDLEVALTHRAG